MSGVRASSGVGLNSAEMKHQRTTRSRSLNRAGLLSNSMPPLPASNVPVIGESFKLPSLARTGHHRTSMVPLSTSEPSLFAPVQRVVFDGFPRRCRPSTCKRSPSLSHCKPCGNTNGPRQSYQPVYTHFSQPIRPVSKLNQHISQARGLSAGRGGLRPLIKQYQQNQPSETLSIRGTPCLPKQPSSTPAVPTARHQLHVFLPVEANREEEDRDSESIDEGFMDEMDNKASVLRHQREKFKTSIQPDVTTLKPALV